MTRILILLLAISITFPYMAADLTLVKDGKPVSCIVLPSDADPVLTHAAEELSLFLGKISAGDKPMIVSAPVEGLLLLSWHYPKTKSCMRTALKSLPMRQNFGLKGRPAMECSMEATKY